MVRREEEAAGLAGLAEKKHGGRRKEAAGSDSGKRSAFFKFLLKGQNGPFTKIVVCT